MSKATIKTLVPKLRFPDFRDAEEWKEKPLGKICKVNPPTSNLPDKFIYIDLESVVSGNLILKKELYKSDAPSRAQRLLKNGDVIYQMVRPYQKNNFFFNTDDGNDYVASTGYAQLRAYSVNTFLFQLIHTDVFVEEVLSKCTGSNYPAIRATDLASIKTIVPKSEEQQKIADCLSSIDELITAHSQKHETLKAHKKGLMQQLFPAQGDDCMDAGGRATQDAKAGTAPKLRFPEFRDAGEWNIRPLKKVFSIFQGFAFSSKDSVTEGVRWLKIADVSIQQMNHSTPSYLPIKHKEKHGRFSVKQGDYVLALTRPILSNQLKMAPVDKVFHGALLNQRVGKLITTENIAFVYFLLQTSQLISDIKKSISGSEPPNLSAQQIENIKTYIPSNKEQQKIADCLSSIDDLITAQVQKIESLKAHKKGLMQQLFPAADEVNG